MSVGYPDATQYPYTSMVKIEATYADGSEWVGSGVMVGPNDILTAAHVVYDPSRGGLAVDVDIFPGYDAGPGALSFTDGAWWANYYEITYTDDDIKDFQSAWDLALIGIDENLGEQTGWLGMQSWAPASSYNHLVGYPSDWGHDNLVESYPIFGGGVSLTDNGNFDVAGYTRGGGMSGGPMINRDGYVVGVHSSSGATNRLDGEWDDLMAWMSGNDFLVPPPPPPPPPVTIADILQEYSPSLNTTVLGPYALDGIVGTLEDARAEPLFAHLDLFA